MSEKLPQYVTLAYRDMLHHGFQLLGDASMLDDRRWMLAEVEHLHNLPSLLFEENVLRHKYYYESERKYYLDRIQSIDSIPMHHRVSLFYTPNWNIIQTFLEQFAS